MDLGFDKDEHIRMADKQVQLEAGCYVTKGRYLWDKKKKRCSAEMLDATRKGQDTEKKVYE